MWQQRGATALLGPLAVGAVLTWSAALSLPDGRLHVIFLVVGDGEAAPVQTPSGEYVLLGGGPSPGKLVEGLGRWVAFSQRPLALVVVAGPAGALPRYALGQAEAGQEIDLSVGAFLRVLSAGQAGVIVRLARRNASFLLPLGATADSLADAGKLTASTVLFVPEQGRKGTLGGVRPAGVGKCESGSYPARSNPPRTPIRVHQ